MNIKLRSHFILFNFLLIPAFLYAQRDTIYLDYNWSLCEKPVASYYRICAINKEKLVFYTGPFEDYYIDGKIEMIGAYDDKGRKEGNFISYYQNGNKKAEGSYKGDLYNGYWSFFDRNERLMMQLNCTNNYDFVPTFLLSQNGDTLLKDGNGRFVFHKDDFKEFFTKESSCRMEGEVASGKKEGTISYYSCFENDKLDYKEMYQNGKFKNSSSEFNRVATDVSFGTIELTSEKLESVESFYHINPLFGNNDQGSKLVLDYIINKNFYGINTKATSFPGNYENFYDIIGYVINGSLQVSNKFSYPANIMDDDRFIFNRIGISSKNNFSPRIIKGNITITIDTTGYVSNSMFKGNFQKEEIDKINYYLSVIYGLKPYINNGMKNNKDINLKVYSYIDSSKVSDSTQRYTYMYLVENGDKVDVEPLPLIPDISAKFPGGQFAWIKYLQKNLNSDMPAENRAPNGNYTVIVSFNVDERGNLSEIKALNDPGYGTAAEAVRVIKAGPAWAPAVLEGKNVPSKQKQSITFQVAGE